MSARFDSWKIAVEGSTIFWKTSTQSPRSASGSLRQNIHPAFTVDVHGCNCLQQGENSFGFWIWWFDNDWSLDLARIEGFNNLNRYQNTNLPAGKCSMVIANISPVRETGGVSDFHVLTEAVFINCWFASLLLWVFNVMFSDDSINPDAFG